MYIRKFSAGLAVAIWSALVGCASSPSSPAKSAIGSKAGCVTPAGGKSFTNSCREAIDVAYCKSVGLIGAVNRCYSKEIQIHFELDDESQWVVACGKNKLGFGGHGNGEAFCWDGGPVIARDAWLDLSEEEREQQQAKNSASVVSAIGAIQTIKDVKANRPSSSTIPSYQGRVNNQPIDTGRQTKPSRSIQSYEPNISVGSPNNQSEAPASPDACSGGSKQSQDRCRCDKISGARFRVDSKGWSCTKGIVLFGCSQKDGKLVCSQT